MSNVRIKDIPLIQTTVDETDWMEIETTDGISKKEQQSVLIDHIQTLRPTKCLLNDINPLASYQVTGASMAVPFAAAIALGATYFVAYLQGGGGSGGGGIASYGGGGGGAGAYLLTPMMLITDLVGDYVCTCGAGGTSSTNAIGKVGNTTSLHKFAWATVAGGGAGIKGVSTGAGGGAGGGYGLYTGAGGAAGASGLGSFMPVGSGGGGAGASGKGGGGGGSGIGATGGTYTGSASVGGTAGLYGYAGGNGGTTDVGAAGGLGAGGGGSLGAANASGAGGNGYIYLWFW